MTQKILSLSKIFYLPITLLFFCSLEAQSSKVNWISFEEAFAKIEENPKPILIDFYTTWCGPCKTMMKTTYRNEEVSSYINENFYPVKFDAEGKDTVNYFGKRYVNKQRIHDLAIKLLGQQQTYPSTLFVDPNTNFSLLVPGLIKPKQMPQFLIYMVENMFRSTPYPKFEKFYKLSKKAVDSTAMTSKPSINWLTTKEAMKKFKKKPKKLLFNFYTDWCEGCKIMDKTTFTHPAIVEYVNENFYAVNFDASSDENIQFLSQKLKGTSANETPFHEFFLTLTNNKPMLPTIVLMSEEPKLILNLPFYRAPSDLKLLLKYYGDDLQKEMTWEEFQKKKKK